MLMVEPRPQVGDQVLYRLSASDAHQILQQRTPRAPAVERRTPTGLMPQGNPVAEGEAYPMTITRVWGEEPSAPVNGQVHLDGNDTLWVISVSVGEGPRTWSWPPRRPRA
jgi:hypothetical protein